MLSKFLRVGANHKKTLVFLAFIIGTYKWARFMNMESWLVKWMQQRYMDKVEKGELFTYINYKSETIVKKFQTNVFEKISKIFDTEKLLEDYQHAKNKSEKVQIWQSVKLLTFCQITSILYANVIFVLGATVHLSVLVAYQHAHEGTSFDIMGSHLNCIVNFIENNLQKICDFIQIIVTPLIQGIHLKENYTFARLEDLFYYIQTSMCLDDQMPLRHMDHYFYNNPNSKFLGPDDSFSETIQEAALFLCADEVISLATSLVSKSFYVLMTEISSDSEFAELTSGLPLVKIIPKLCKRLNSQFYEKVFVNCMPSDETMQSLSANVFEAFSS